MENIKKNLSDDFKVKTKLFPFINNIQLINKLKIDPESVYYISIRDVANEITNIIKNHVSKLKLNIKDMTITDATAGVGGNTISFAREFKSVNSIEIDILRSEYLKNNINVYELKNITVYTDDYLNVCSAIKQDIIFLDPPWGGRDYKKKDAVQLKLSNKGIESVCKLMLDKCKIIAIKVPINFDLSKLYEDLYFSPCKIFLYELKKMNLLILEIL